MNKSVIALFLGSMLSIGSTQAFDAKPLSSYPKAAAQHIFSADGVKDIAAAYIINVLITLIHEMGHAAVAKLTCGAPVDVVIGGARKKEPWLKCCGIEFAGFNVLESDARWEERRAGDDQIYSPTIAQDTAMLLAGPLAQALTGYCLYKCLQNQDKFYIAKATAIGGIVDTVVGINGIYGALRVPWSDASKIVNNIKKYWAK